MNKTVMMILPVVIIAVIAGLAFSGVIDIPGISPAKKKAKNAAAMYADKDEKLAQNKPATPEQPKKQDPPKKEEPTTSPVAKDPEQGADALATVWNELPTANLMKITASWKDEDLVKVLMHMETEKVAQLLDLIASGDSDAKIAAKPERASKLSKILQDESSILKKVS